MVLQCYAFRRRALTRAATHQQPQQPEHRPVSSRGRGASPDRLLLDGPHLVADALARGPAASSSAAILSTAARTRLRFAALMAELERTGVDVVIGHGPGHGGGQPGPIVQRDRRPRAAALPPMRRRLYAGAAPLVLIATTCRTRATWAPIVRAAEAGRATSVIAAGACADPFGWKALRGSSGSALRLPIGAAATAAARDRRRAPPRLPHHRHRAARRALAVRRRPARRARPILIGGEGPGL